MAMQLGPSNIPSYNSIYLLLAQLTTCLVPCAVPIGDKTHKPKLLKPQPRKVVLVSTIHA